MPTYIGGTTPQGDEPRRVPLKAPGRFGVDDLSTDLWRRATGKECDVTVSMATQVNGRRTLIQRHLYKRMRDGQHRYFSFEIPMQDCDKITVPDMAPLVELQALRHQYTGSI